MILIGQLDSPFVRRVAVSLHLLEMPFERRPLSVFGNADEVRKLNPLGRVPILVLGDGEVLFESGAILDHLDEVAGPGRALTPAGGPERRRALRLVALATGAADKAVALLYDRRLRPAETHYAPWSDRLAGQLQAALAALEKETGPGWYFQELARPMQPDITVAAMLGLLRLSLPDQLTAGRYPRLEGLSARAEVLPAFQAAVPPPGEQAPRQVS
jgi:glutathione S-transferase